MNNKPWFQNPRETQPTPRSASTATTAAAATAAASAAPAASTANVAPAAPVAAAADAGPAPSQLIVGPKIRLNGAEIEQCDSLVIEGHVKATVKSRSLRITATGTFEGDADIETAEIEGHYEGTLNASTRLVVKSTGRISGTVRYGRLVVEDGGEIGGDVRPIGAGEAARPGEARAPAAVRKDAPRETTVRDGLLSSQAA